MGVTLPPNILTRPARIIVAQFAESRILLLLQHPKGCLACNLQQGDASFQTLACPLRGIRKGKQNFLLIANAERT